MEEEKSVSRLKKAGKGIVEFLERLCRDCMRFMDMLFILVGFLVLGVRIPEFQNLYGEMGFSVFAFSERKILIAMVCLVFTMSIFYCLMSYCSTGAESCFSGCLRLGLVMMILSPCIQYGNAVWNLLSVYVVSAVFTFSCFVLKKLMETYREIQKLWRDHRYVREEGADRKRE